MSSLATPHDLRAARWQAFLGALESHALAPQPLEAVGLLVRVAGLVLEAAEIGRAHV